MNLDQAAEWVKDKYAIPENKQKETNFFNRYKEVFSLGNLNDLSVENFTSFLKYDNNTHWTGLERLKGKLTRNFDKLREAINILVDESQPDTLPIEDRINMVVSRDSPNYVKYLQRAVITPILLVTHDDKYGVYNSITDKGLKETNLMPKFERGENFGSKYSKINQVLIKTAKHYDINLYELDEVWYCLKLEPTEIIPPYDTPLHLMTLEVNFDAPLNFTKNGLYFQDKQSLRQRIKAALKSGKHLILYGPPGSGKSKLAKVICNVFRGEDYVFATGNSDWSTADTIGSYHIDEDGKIRFKEGYFLQCLKNPDDLTQLNKWLIIDELNRADIDKAFGAFFSILANDSVTLAESINDQPIKINVPQRGEEVTGDETEEEAQEHIYSVHPHWRIIATMNTRDKASLYKLSFAFMKRFAFIPVDIPIADQITEDLLRKYIDVWQESNFQIENDEIAKMVQLWKTLSECKVDIGPSIIFDICSYLSKIPEQGKASPWLDIIVLFLLPQLEGMSIKHFDNFTSSLSQNGLLSDQDIQMLKAQAKFFIEEAD